MSYKLNNAPIIEPYSGRGWPNLHRSPMLIKIMMLQECETVKKLHNYDPNSWLYKDYLCPDIFRIIMDYLQA